MTAGAWNCMRLSALLCRAPKNVVMSEEKGEDDYPIFVLQDAQGM